MKKLFEFLNNKWTILLIVLAVVFSLIVLHNIKTSKSKYSKWRYEIRGKVLHNGKPHDAIWYTDTIEMGDNYVKYENSDGTEVIIPSPYILVDRKYDNLIVDTLPAF